MTTVHSLTDNYKLLNIATEIFPLTREQADKLRKQKRVQALKNRLHNRQLVANIMDK